MKYYNFVTQVQSKSNPTKFYTVKMRTDGLLTCNCPSWVYNQRGNRTCKHIDEIIKAGFTADKRGKFITGVRYYGEKIPIFCKNYPDKCDDCKLKFLCYTEANPEFTEGQIKEAGIRI